MAEKLMETIEFDIRGQICPSALLMALRQVNVHQTPLRGGLVQLVVLTDNRDSTTTISEAVGNMGYEVRVSRDEAAYRVSIASRA